MSKKFFYYVNPMFFKDSNGDGFGDFEGFIKQINYIKMFNFDYVIFPDIFNNISDLKFKNFTSIKNIYGSYNTYQNLIQCLKDNNINFGQEIKLRKITKSSLLGKNYESESSIKKTFFLEKNLMSANDLKWKSKQNLDAFKTIVKKLAASGVDAIIISEFEYLNSRNELVSEDSVFLLKELCEIIKKISPKIKFMLKSSILPTNIIRYIFRADACDYFINTSPSRVFLNRIEQAHRIEKFKAKRFYKLILAFLSIRNNESLSKEIISLADSDNGRINSKFGKENILFFESARALLAMQLFVPTHSLIYCGDELGTLNINFENYGELNDPYIYEKKREWQSKGWKEKDFRSAVYMFSSISSCSYFQWSSKKNLDFTTKNINELHWKITNKNKYINSINEYNDLDSPLHFCINTIDFIKNSEYQNFFNNFSDYKVGYHKQILYIKYFLGKNQLKVSINLTNSIQIFYPLKNSKIIFCSNFKKEFKNKIDFILPFEVLIETGLI